MATACTNSARAIEPATRSLTVEPERYSAPPKETWMMPSELASVKPRRAAIAVCELDTFTAG